MAEPVVGVFGGNLKSWHPGKHAVGPEGLFTGSFSVINNFFAFSQSHHDVILCNRLIAKDDGIEINDNSCENDCDRQEPGR